MRADSRHRDIERLTNLVRGLALCQEGKHLHLRLRKAESSCDDGDWVTGRRAAALEGAFDRASAAEQAIFSELSAAVMALRDVLTRISDTAAALELVSGLAQAAAKEHWRQPK